MPLLGAEPGGRLGDNPKSVASDARRPHNVPLTVLLVALTLGTGAMDVVSFTRLGGVFSSVMTGNLVVLGLAAARRSAAVPVSLGLAVAVAVGRRGEARGRANGVPGLRRTEVAVLAVGSGHKVMLERPDIVLDAIRHMLVSLHIPVNR